MFVNNPRSAIGTVNGKSLFKTVNIDFLTKNCYSKSNQKNVSHYTASIKL